MAEPTIPDGINLVWWLMGSGSLGAIGLALVGKMRGPKPPAAPVPTPIQIETPWLVQNILEIKLEIEGVGKNLSVLSQVVSAMSVQVNTVAALLNRRRDID